MLNAKLLFLTSLLLCVQSLAQSTPKLDTEDRLYDLEAQVSTLKSELESVKNLSAQEKPSAFNPSISVIGDLGGQYGFNLSPTSHDENHDDDGHAHSHGSDFKNGVSVKEIEFEFRGEVDPFADALVAFAIAPHGFDHVDLHLEEAYVRLKTWPGLGFSPLGMIIKAGKFKTALGRLNRVHRHNISQTDYPLAMKAFLGDEGYAAPGLSLNTVFNPTEKSAINIFVEGVTGARLPMQEKGAEKMPSGLLHLWWHQELAPAHFLDIGTSGLVSRKGKEGSGTFFLVGADLHYSYIPSGYGQNPLFLFGNEFYSANKQSAPGRWPMGNFTWAQIRIFGSTFFGARYDLAPKKHDLLSFEHALGAYVTHYTTEFLRFRLGYEHVMPEIKSFNGDHRLMLSVVFVLGSHPVEPYFVNR